ncbi:MAG: protein kinase, partial [Planctomycetota bacterium]
MQGDDFLANAVLKNGFVSETQLEECRKVQKESPIPISLASILVKRKLVTDGQLGILLGLYKETMKISGAGEDNVEGISFGETAVKKNMASNEDIWKAIEEQNADDKRGAPHRIGEILTEKGTLTVFQAQEILESQGKRILKCTACNNQYNVKNYDSENDYTCSSCGAPLEVPRILSTVAVHGTAADDVSHKIEMDDKFVGKDVGGCEILAKLGEGGMGAVYKARHIALNKPVAIKIMSAALMGDMHRKRFLREARAAAMLDHPNVVTIHDTGEFEGYNYIVMQFIDGKSVGSMLENEGRIPELKSVRIMKQAAAGLGSAHKLKMIHRDVKPDNIMMTRDGFVKVADFGLVKSAEVEKDLTGMTKSMLMGTPHYMAPEQFEGQVIDHRTDIYALGVTFYHMLTGKRPYHGTTPFQIMQGHLQGDYAQPDKLFPDISQFTCQIVAKMMAKDRDKRYPTMDEVQEDLERAEEYLRKGLKPPSAPAVEQDEFVLETDSSLESEIENMEETVKTPPPPSAPITPTTIAPPPSGPAPYTQQTPSGTAPVHAKKSIIPIVVVLLLVAAAIGVAGFFFLSHKPPADKPNNVVVNPTPTPVELPKEDLEKEAKAKLDEIVNIAKGLVEKKVYKNAVATFDKFPEKYYSTKVYEIGFKSEKRKLTNDIVNKHETIYNEIKTKLPNEIIEAESKFRELENNYNQLSEYKDEDWCKEIGLFVSDAQERIRKAQETIPTIVAPTDTEKDKFTAAKVKANKKADEKDFDKAIAICEPFISSKDDSIKTEAVSLVNKYRLDKFNEADKKGEQWIAENKFELASTLYKDYIKEPYDYTTIKKPAQERLDEIKKKESEFASSEKMKKLDEAKKFIDTRTLENYAIAERICKEYNEEKGRVGERANELLKEIEFRRDMSKADEYIKVRNFDEAFKLCNNHIVNDNKEFATEARQKRIQVKKERYKDDNLIFIEGGKFVTGSNDTGDNNPQQEVNITSCYISQYEVTNRDYEMFVKNTERKTVPMHWGGNKVPLGKEKHPVTWVSCEDAVEYCDWLTKNDKKGRKYRLPNESEWEYAASYDPNTENNKRKYPWGNEFGKTTLNISGKDTTACGSNRDDVSYFEIYDMGGNVCEWVQSDDGESYAVRGGSWKDMEPEEVAKTAFRHKIQQNT